ncbi:L-ribulose-5-phosphate 3-epimerase [Paramicrobacterium chengjingii]|uniref:L-ribulose-5-phosphate 3-epimerase n=1 Tax=Paramicrobacterium chengjingii TaxID=2769067 RepID=A0ABX6YHR0_9MICO|nr:L-ribulose-5-phosphate 3-epimerase [Microbacterium chengjingii]QPZ38332.1 L-ribulose-5-phosphate 3-epimerase [Microbacterium chengjingii]
MTCRKGRLPAIRRVSSAIGLYEKALSGRTWADRFRQATTAGYDFVELSIDSSPQKLERLSWSERERSTLRQYAADAGSRIGTIVLSAHRDFPWGSPEASIRHRADELARDAIGLARDLGAHCVQIAGYFVFDGQRDENVRDKFIEGMRVAAAIADEQGITLAIENVDGQDVLSASDGIALLADIDVPDVKLYIDVGNYAGNRLDVVEELTTALPYAYAVQFKDARPGVFRRVPFGDGVVPWPEVLAVLEASELRGAVSIEMWNDDEDPAMVADALRWFESVTFP